VVPQEPTPLPVRPRLDFEAGPVTGATLATGQIPVIGAGPGEKKIPAEPVDPPVTEGRAGKPVSPTADPEPNAAEGRSDDEAWTASLRLSDNPEWGASPPSGYQFPQIFSPGAPPSPISGIPLFGEPDQPSAAAEPASPKPRPALAEPIRVRPEGLPALEIPGEEAPAQGTPSEGKGSQSDLPQASRLKAGPAEAARKPDARPLGERLEEARALGILPEVGRPRTVRPSEPHTPEVETNPRGLSTSAIAGSTPAGGLTEATEASASTASAHAVEPAAPTHAGPPNTATPPDASTIADSPTARSASTGVRASTIGPPTAPTTVLPLRREMRDKHADPAPRRSRTRTFVGVIRRALGRRKTRPHRGSADPQTLGNRFSPRSNHLGLMRLLLALAVGVTHATEIGYGWQPEFVHTQLGELCVDAFFVLSGFLLVGSYLRLDSIRRYTWHRFLRIMPGFWVCLVLTATLIAPLIAWLQGVPMKSTLGGQDSAVDYVIRNATLMMRQWGISGLPNDVQMAGVLNGSLWTLFYEATCYASIILLGVFGGLRRRPVMTLGAVGAIWVVIVLNDYQIVYVGQERILRLSFMFLIGSVLYLYAHQIPVSRLLTLVAAGVLVSGIMFFDDYRVIAGPAFGYLCLALAVSRVRVWEPKTDISYGLYVYHWPILQVLNLLGVAAYGIWAFAPAGLAVTAVVALLSWKLVEKPALGFKDAAWVTWKPPVAQPATSKA
jgi:peptidoglycan/LPS O-acetylase OafA/YrhL